MFFSDKKIPSTYYLINNPKKLSWLCNELMNTCEFAFDIETNHPTSKSKKIPDGFVEKLTGISFAWNHKHFDIWQPGTAAYLPIRKADDSSFWLSRHDIVLNRLSEILSSPADKIAQNGKFDVRKLCELEDIRVKNFTFDTMLAHVMLDEENLVSSHKLKSEFSQSTGNIVKLGMSDAYLDTSASQFKEDMDEELNFYDPVYKRYSKVPLNTLYPYGCSDSDYTLALKHIFEKKLEEEEMSWMFSNVVMPIQHELTMMELHGVPVDINVATKVKEDQERIMQESAKEVHRLCNKVFDVGSSKQLGAVLFEEMGLKGTRNEHGRWITDADALKDLDHPVVSVLSKYKRADKIRGTYAVPSLINIKEVTNEGTIGWVHPTYFMMNVTPRLGMSDPTLNTLPRPENGGDIVKSMYVAPPGYKFIFKDFSQVELRIIAHFSQEPVWIEGFLNGHDMHAAMAQRIWHPDCDVSYVKKHFKESRSKAKAVNFGIAYGRSPFALSVSLGITLEEAEKLVYEDYFGAAPVLKQWIEDMHQFVIAEGYVCDLFGRRRHLPDAQIMIPEGTFWPKKFDRPECYRKGPILKDLNIDFEDVHYINEADLKIRVRKIGKKNVYRCADCVHMRSCIINGYVKYISGRVNSAKRRAVNAPVQGTGAHATSLAMYYIGREFRKQQMDAAVFMNTHDEIAVLAQDSCVDQANNIMDYYMSDYMKQFMNFSVPLVVDTEIVQRWIDKHEKED